MTIDNGNCHKDIKAIKYLYQNVKCIYVRFSKDQRPSGKLARFAMVI